MPDLLSALVRLHGDLTATRKLPAKGFAAASVAADILLSADGAFLGLQPRAKGDTADILPIPPARSSNVAAAFLSGGRDYWFGGNRPRAQTCRRAMQELHKSVLAGVNDADARAILAFLAASPPAIDVGPMAGFIALRIDGRSPQNNHAIRAAWSRAYAPDTGSNPRVQIMPGSAMTRLVSANLPAASSYEQEEAVLPPAIDGAAYAAALRWLADRPSTVRINDTAIMAWVEGHPHIDPTPDLIAMRDLAELRAVDAGDGAYPGDVHVAVVSVTAPGRLWARLYHVIDGQQAGRNFAMFRARLRAADPQSNRTIGWAYSLIDSPRREQLIAGVIQAVMLGDELPHSVLSEIVRLNRASPSKMRGRIPLLTIALNFDRHSEAR
ncbi:type I-C CRISPR-associated protein Cas8c/Csd1 [Camelimonas sp. ID_303_24]